jgi:hypothetical protein
MNRRREHDRAPERVRVNLGGAQGEVRADAVAELGDPLAIDPVALRDPVDCRGRLYEIWPYLKSELTKYD